MFKSYSATVCWRSNSIYLSLWVLILITSRLFWSVDISEPLFSRYICQQGCRDRRPIRRLVYWQRDGQQRRQRVSRHWHRLVHSSHLSRHQGHQVRRGSRIIGLLSDDLLRLRGDGHHGDVVAPPQVGRWRARRAAEDKDRHVDVLLPALDDLRPVLVAGELLPRERILNRRWRRQHVGKRATSAWHICSVYVYVCACEL